MKKFILSGLLTFLLSCSLAFSLFASGEFLKIGVGERPCGMGEAFGAVSDNVNATYWNPAGLAQLARPEFSVMHMQYVMTEFRINYLGIAMPLKKGVIGIDGRLMTNQDTYRDDNGNAAGSFMNYNGVGTVAYSYPVSRSIYTGISMKYFYEQYESQKTGQILFDLGTMYRRVLGINLLRLGLVAQNLGLDSFGNNFKIGASYQFGFGPLLATDIDLPAVGEVKYSFGIEYGFLDRFSFRSGYRFISNARPASGFTFGIGFSILKYGIDYSYIPYGDLGITHRLSLSGKF